MICIFCVCICVYVCEREIETVCVSVYALPGMQM